MTDWVRLWHDMPTDPKWRTIARRAGQRVGDVLAVFNFVMVNASANSVERGRLAGFDLEDVATALDLDEADVHAVLTAMQGKVLDGDRLTGWDKRQPKREDSAAERTRQWRERKQTQANADGRTVTNGDAHVTQRDAPETGTEEDTEKVRVTADAAFAFEGRVIRLKPADLGKWQKSYPALDVPALLQSRDDWLSTEADGPTRKKWFISTSNYLAGLQQKAAALAKEPAWNSPC